MDLCISCDEIGWDLTLFECSHAFCPKCQLDKINFNNELCPVCQEKSKPVIEFVASKEIQNQVLEFKPRVLVNGPTLTEIKQRYDYLKSKPNISETDQRVIDEWYLSANKIHCLNENTINLYNEKIKNIHHYKPIALIWSLIQNSEKIQLNPNPLPLACWFGRLSFTSTQDYSRLTFKQRIDMKMSGFLTFNFSPTGDLVTVEESGSGRLLPDRVWLTFKGRKIKHLCWSLQISEDRIYTQDDDEKKISIFNYDLELIGEILMESSILTSRVYQNRVFILTQDNFKLHCLDPDLKLVQSKSLELSLDRDLPYSMEITPSRVYIFTETKVRIFDSQTFDLLKTHPQNLTVRVYDQLNDVFCMNSLTNTLNIFDPDLNLIGQAHLPYPDMQISSILPTGDIYFYRDEYIEIY